MRELTDGVWQVSGLVPHLINCYVLATPTGDVIIDAGTRWTAGRLVRQLCGRKLVLAALTHVHPDHQGAAAAVCQRFGVPLACHAADADVMEGKQPMAQPHQHRVGGHRLLSGPPHPVEVRWQGGEMLGEWRVIHTPGHTPGHVIFFRQRDRVVVSGDLTRNTRLRSGGCRLIEPPHFFSVDPMRNRESLRLLADLHPDLVCPGHGPPFRNASDVERLAQELALRLAPARSLLPAQ
jgi:glyoxylase-like metal-dependent hydrolase (beta-lactamase superfamily II)